MTKQQEEGQEGQVELAVDYRASPLAIPSDKTLSFEARVLLTWLFQHGNGWKFIIGYALKTLGISQSTWKRRIRKELIDRGFFLQRRLFGEVGASGFRWSNVFTDKPLRLGCQNVPIQPESIQAVRVHGDTDTESLIVNKSYIKQKRESKKTPAAALSNPSNSKKPTPAPPGQPPSSPPGRALLADKEKEARDLAYAKRIGGDGGLSEQEVEEAIQSARYPSLAPAAVEAAIKAKAAAAAQAARAAALAAPPVGMRTPEGQRWPHPIKNRPTA